GSRQGLKWQAICCGSAKGVWMKYPPNQTGVCNPAHHHPVDNSVPTMSFLLAKNWSSLLIRGAAAILMGLVAIGLDGITLHQLALLFCTWTFVEGSLGISGAAYSPQGRERWAVLLFEGFAGVVAAIVALAWRQMTIPVFVGLAAVWALTTGAMQIAGAIRLR